MVIRQPKSSTKVLLIGDSCTDVYHYGVCERMSPEAPVPVFRHIETKTIPGMCLNVLANLEAFGLSVDTLTSESKIVKERFLDIKSKQHLLRADYGEKEKTPPLDVSSIDKINFENYDAVIFSDYDKGFVTKEVIEKVLEKVGNKKVFVDTKKEDISPYENCIIKINKHEYERNTKLPKNHELVITAGADGAFYKSENIPTKKVDVSDVSGAGDTFLSALVFHVLSGMNMTISIMRSLRYSTYVVQKSGTYALTKEDVEIVRKQN